MKNAVVFLADGFEEIEALSTVDYLRRGNVEVFTVAVPSPTMDNEKPNIVTAAHGVSVIADLDFEEFKGTFRKHLPDLAFVPGGMPGAKNCSECQELLDFLTKCFDEGKHVAAICAAPAVVLSKTKILEGKKWTCYPGMQLDVSAKDSVHIQNVPFVTDKNLTTGRGPGAAEQFSMELVRILCGKDVADDIKIGSCQR